MNRYYKTLGSALLVLLLSACGSKDTHKTASATAYEVKPMPLHKSLHFTGTIQPLKEHTLSSPMEAVVETMNYHYGQRVHKGDVVMTLSSNELQKQYNDTLTEYLKAKDNYTIAKAKFVGTQDLWKSGLLPRNNYLSEKSSVDTSRVTLMQSRGKLKDLLEKMEDTQSKNLSDLRLADFDKVQKILSAHHNVIHLKAPGDGVLLYPPKSGEDKATRITVGSTLKPGQVIALVGDLKGISIEIDVPEIDIDTIKPGMSATISGVAFGTHHLKGKLVAVNAQASATSNAGLPSFTALVEVSSLLPEEQHWIKVGMSAAIELRVDSTNQLLVPIAAVKREKGNSFVILRLPNKSTEKRIITTGSAQADSVVVESGLKAGDVVIYD
ncbi:MAG: efflux RND transporter periplasmic adaptor subunit [Legionellales bacterium]